MKKLLLLLLVITAMVGCQTVRVSQDYAIGTDFNQYKTFAYLKKGIDEAQISELDKKRILRAIDSEMIAKGFTKSENPDVLVSIFTDSKERVNVYNN
ncbi:lipoprotein, putative [Nonlabens marinus S1-08]|uniref:Lipoprotein, putative n=1 Tax=Nonlabens marinus S1-08 TaxID=1454201 RepID=W8VVQ5_9FLAO|nr:lipoprotein, putative [Nonlabens marinus S1-08]